MNLFKNKSFFQLNLTLNSEAGGDISTYIENGEWSLIGTIDVTNVIAKWERGAGLGNSCFF